MLPLARLLSVGRKFTLDSSLLSALVDRWRPETHTFHFRWGEMTVTLQDVSFLTGLPIRGVPLVPSPPSVDWKARLEQRFGQPLPEGARGVPRAWLRQFRECPEGAPHEVVRTYLVAYLLQLFGWVMFPTTKGDLLNPSFICIAESLVDAGAGPMPQYSWGSAVLCATYRGLCDASRHGTTASNLAVCYVLLQLWSWEHFPVGRPTIERAAHPYTVDGPGPHDAVDAPTMGLRWTAARLRWASARPARCYSLYHNEFESLHESDIIWCPWYPDFLLEVAPHGLSVQCIQDVLLWRTTCHLVFSHMVEPHAPQRVMRQFGMYQFVPPRTAGTWSEPYTCESNFIRVMFAVLTSSFLTLIFPEMQAIEGGWAYSGLANGAAGVDYDMDEHGARGCLE